MIGKIRLGKILKGDHRTTVVAVDHGLTSGPIGGINQEETLPCPRSRSTRRCYPPCKPSLTA
jgi:hypothetical protein